MYETILVPVDGSAGADEALRHGVDLAQHYDATVHLVYVVDVGVYGHYGGVDAIEHAEEALEEAGEELLAEARDAVTSADLAAEVHLTRTTPHEGITETARQVGADLVVMGTERRSADYRHMLGSVSERVIRTTPVPVHLVKADTGPGPELEIRAAVPEDAGTVRAVASRSMQRSYGSFLEASTIDAAVDDWFGRDRFEDLLGDPTAIVLVAEADGTVVGFSQGHVVETPSGSTGTVHWLHVAPNHRGRGIGEQLFEHTSEALTERDVDRIRGLVLAANERGAAFYRAMGLEEVGRQEVELGGESRAELVFAEPEAPGAGAEERQPVATTTEEGETLYVDYEESEIGSKAPFFAAYRTADRETRYGWFCSNCESFDTAMDPMGRIVCNQCGNRHKATRWDAVATE